MHDYLGAEQIIINQLDTQLRELLKGHVLSAVDLEGVKEQSQITPAAHIIFFDDVPVAGDKGRSAHNQRVDQLWLVVVVVKNVKGKTGMAARKQAGPIISGVIKQLHYFDPGHPYTKLTRVKAPYRATYRNGFFYFPMMFKTRFSTEGNNNGR